MEQLDKKTILFEQTPVPKAVAQLAVPTVLSSLVMVLYNLADTYFVGQLNDPVQNAAVTLAAPVLLAFNAVNNLFGVGSSSMMSRALGQKDYETVARSSAFGFYCAILFGVLLAAGCTLFKTPLLKLLGADATTAEATAAYMFWTVTLGAVPAILNVVACLYFAVLLLVKRGHTYVCVHPKKFWCGRRIMGGVFAVGIPASIQNLLNVTGMTVLNNFTAAYGASAVAAMGIAQKINIVPMYVSMGISQGIMPLISYNYASGNVDRMKHTVRFSRKAALSIILLISAFYFLLPGVMVSLFMQDPEIVQYGSRFLRGFCLGLPFLCVDFLAVGVFQAVGMGKEALAFAILRKVLLEIPALLILNWLFPLYGLAYAQFIAECILSVAAVLVLRRLFRRLESQPRPSP